MFGSDINNKGKKEKNQKVKAGPCIFPFTYKWKEHTKCVPTNKGDICATSLSEKRPQKRTLKTYGYCTKKPKIKIKKSTVRKLRKLKGRKLTIKKIDKNKKKSNKATPTIRVKMPKKIRIKKKATPKSQGLNKSLLGILGQLEDLMKLKGEPFRARAYHNAAETIMLYQEPITDIKQLKGKPGIGKTIMEKFNEYLTTGKLKTLERAKGDPLYLFPKIYGIGPKKAKQLVDAGVTTLAELRERQDELLNTNQKLGLKYFEDIEKRIPRAEINEYSEILADVFSRLKHVGSRFEIVGSYRRGAKDSGDIDIIVTNDQNDSSIFNKFIEALQKRGIIIQILTKGKTKSMVMGQLPGQTPRRLDFMYASPAEYSFAILYFTGSKSVNVVMRQRALDLGYSMNEHGLYKMNGKKKGPRLDVMFPTERSIFEFLGLEYKKPTERIDGRSVVLKSTDEPTKEVGIVVPQAEMKQTKPKVRRARVKSLKKTKTTKKTSKKFVPRKALLALAKDGISELKGLSEEQLSTMIHYANDAYYNKKPVITDNVYDILKEYIGRNYPDNIAITEVGAPVQKNKVALPYYMGSMEKIKPDTGALTRWKKKYKGPYVISAKLDGMSVMYSSEHGQKKLYSRGAATNGLDLSHMIPYLKLPSDENITIRGELIIPIAVFDKKYKGKGYKSARNFVGGVMNSKGREVSKWKSLNFVAYEVIKPELKPSAQMRWLESHGAITVKNTTTKKITNESLSDILVDWRSSYKYEIDGIIVVNDKIYPRENKNPAHAFAFKMVLSDQVVEAKVVDVNYSISKYGYLKPVIQIEPVHIRGADIEFATAHNIKNVIDNNIGIGAIVRLSRSGDVIPKIEEVIVPAEEPKLPDVPWKWNETHVDALLKDSEASSEVRNKNIVAFFKDGLKVTGFGEGNILKVINSGFDSVPKILRMSKADFLTVPNFKEKTVNKIYPSLKNKIETISLAELMNATNIFGRGMGESRLSAILDEYPDILTMDASSEEKETLVRGIEGFAVKTANLFVTRIPQFMEFINETNLQSKLTQSESKVDQSHPLYDKKILLTGFRDKALETEIKARGGKISSSASSKVFIVLVPTMDADTSKANEARRKKLTLMTPEVFTKKYL
jgi:NAD-dependent DNA ligase/DNA polymerase/3'-5' exonuclease PolX